MRRFLVLAPVVLAGCFASRSHHWAGLFSHEVRSEVQLARLLDDMDEVKHKLDHPPPVRQLAPATAAPVYRRPRDGRISARVMFAGGHMQLIAMPEKSRDEAVLAFRPVARLDDRCSVRLWLDGSSLDVGQQLRRTDHELLVSLRIDELGKSERFSGTACGQSFELDAAGRDTIATFVARFHERVDELSASPSRSVADAR
jgi:hypothetical protein